MHAPARPPARMAAPRPPRGTVYTYAHVRCGATRCDVTRCDAPAPASGFPRARVAAAECDGGDGDDDAAAGVPWSQEAPLEGGVPWPKSVVQARIKDAYVLPAYLEVGGRGWLGARAVLPYSWGGVLPYSWGGVCVSSREGCRTHVLLAYLEVGLAGPGLGWAWLLGCL